MKVERRYGPEVRVECPECHSILLVGYRDVKEYVINCDYLGDCDHIRGLCCKVCNYTWPYTFPKNPE